MTDRLGAHLLLAAATLMGCGSRGEEPGTSTGGGQEPEPTYGVIAGLCPPGERERSDGTCQAAGVPAQGCANGFVHQDGGCHAPLPRCASGTMALPGDEDCRPVAPCGNGPWGAIPVEPDTVFVDAAYVGGDGDGTMAKPFPDLQQAVDAAPSGSMVALAAGSYLGLTLDKPIRLWGRCPELVELQAPVNAVLGVLPSAAGSEVHQVALHEGAHGVVVNDSEALIDRVWIHDLLDSGIVGFSGAVEVRDSLIERVEEQGIEITGSDVTVSGVAIRDVVVDEGVWAPAIAVQTPATSNIPELVVERVVVERVIGLGISSSGYRFELVDSLIRGVFPGEAAGGACVLASGQGANRAITITGSVIEDCPSTGIHAVGGDVVVERTSLRGVGLPENDPFAIGIDLGREVFATDIESVAHVSDSIVEHGRFGGLSATATELTLEGLIVRDMAGDPAQPTGAGIELLADPESGQTSTALLEGCVIEEVTRSGIVAEGAVVDIDQTLIRDVAPDSDGAFGRGISLERFELTPTEGRLTRSRVARATEAGITVLGGTVALESVEVVDMQPLGAGPGRGIDVETLQSFVPSHADLRNVSVTGNTELGLVILAATGSLTDSAIEATGPTSDGRLGDGASVVHHPLLMVPTALEVRSSLVRTSHRAGMSSFGATLSIVESWLDCNAIDLNAEVAGSMTPDVVDGGGNRCGCGDEQRTCKVLSAGLAPPEALE